MEMLSVFMRKESMHDILTQFGDVSKHRWIQDRCCTKGGGGREQDECAVHID